MKFTRFEASQIRMARPTDQFEKVIDFYESGLGLERLTDFSGHRGYEGVVYGLPGLPYHLEFTRHEAGSPCPAPTKDNLLVFYIENRDEVLNTAERLQDMGYKEVESENPYWKEKGITIEDPDGWRVVLMNTLGI
ncbi:VOC family protein [Halobacillus litoralis]|uniref:VOC family protein n=1 Tax=Halobacillus litoralis TaxID=45668 RepID=A0A845F5Z0_9BACI|nr:MULTISPECIES: VOC family protein [Halobacillus]MEC3884258.1 VOC family protein [Halobacillus sp. HZG1]MYL69340.1 VOC family protein [Halobacillus litoralis]